MWFESDVKLWAIFNTLNYIILDPIKAYETIWFMDDEFATKSFEQYFKSKGVRNVGGGYIPDKFNIVSGFSMKYTSADQNMISRIHNSMALLIH